ERRADPDLQRGGRRNAAPGSRFLSEPPRLVPDGRASGAPGEVPSEAPGVPNPKLSVDQGIQCMLHAIAVHTPPPEVSRVRGQPLPRVGAVRTDEGAGLGPSDPGDPGSLLADRSPRTALPHPPRAGRAASRPHHGRGTEPCPAAHLIPVRPPDT